MRMQPTAFGARDRSIFDAILCRASAAADAQPVGRFPHYNFTNAAFYRILFTSLHTHSHRTHPCHALSRQAHRLPPTTLFFFLLTSHLLLTYFLVRSHGSSQSLHMRSSLLVSLSSLLIGSPLFIFFTSGFNAPPHSLVVSCS